MESSLVESSRVVSWSEFKWSQVESSHGVEWSRVEWSQIESSLVEWSRGVVDSQEESS